MNLWSAAVFLVRASLANWVRTQATRLRRPRYAIGLAVVGLYVWSLLIGAGDARVRATPEANQAVVVLGAAMALLGVAGAWVFGGDDAVLRFTQAEVQFLFPAPVTRRHLVVYKMGRTVFATLFSVIVATLVFGLRFTDHVGWFVIGAWIGLVTLHFHLSAASLTRAMLVDFGIAGLRRRLLTLGVLVAAAGALGFAAIRIAPPPPLDDPGAVVRWASSAIHEPPLGWVLLPVRASLDLAMAQSRSAFLAALPGALGVLGLHVAWMLSTARAFEDASVVAADRQAALAQARRRGWSPLRRARSPFPLAGTGRPEVALVWKSVLAAIRVASLRMVLAIALLAMSSAFIASAVLEGRSSWFGIGALGGCALAGYVALVGPQVLRVDLRLDLPLMDVLQSWPLSGRAVVTGQIAGPAAILAVLEWLALLGALGFATGWEGPPGASERLAFAAAAAIALPTMSACGLAVQNGAVLLFPEWAALDAQVGPEALGRRLILLVANLLVMLFALLPATVVAALVFALGIRVLGLAALPIGAAAGALVVAIELWVVLGWLGRWFERFDVSDVPGLSDR